MPDHGLGGIGAVVEGANAGAAVGVAAGVGAAELGVGDAVSSGAGVGPVPVATVGAEDGVPVIMTVGDGRADEAGLQAVAAGEGAPVPDGPNGVVEVWRSGMALKDAVAEAPAVDGRAERLGPAVPGIDPADVGLAGGALVAGAIAGGKAGTGAAAASGEISRTARSTIVPATGEIAIPTAPALMITAAMIFSAVTGSVLPMLLAYAVALAVSGPSVLTAMLAARAVRVAASLTQPATVASSEDRSCAGSTRRPSAR